LPDRVDNALVRLMRYVAVQGIRENQRIINAIRQRMKLDHDRMYSNIADNGNTSSSTIPICLNELLPEGTKDEIWGITAFGGGFTDGAALIRPR
jgi:3-oxoacyl-[acyl-carrier-protein] synthase III